MQRRRGSANFLLLKRGVVIYGRTVVCRVTKIVFSCVPIVYSFGELKYAFNWTYLFHKQVKQVLDEILEKLPDEFNVPEMMARVEDRTPYTVVAFQECERMNILTSEIKRSLKELDLGLKVSPEF